MYVFSWFYLCYEQMGSKLRKKESSKYWKIHSLQRTLHSFGFRCRITLHFWLEISVRLLYRLKVKAEAKPRSWLLSWAVWHLEVTMQTNTRSDVFEGTAKFKSNLFIFVLRSTCLRYSAWENVIKLQVMDIFTGS